MYRGTRPKASLSNSNLVYCDKCECRYSVLKQINADQWLNYHWAHFNCVQKKLIRQQEDNDDIPVAKFRESTTSRSDTTFVIEGVRQDTAFGREDMGSDEDSVDSATNFEIRLPVGDDDMDDKTYDELLLPIILFLGNISSHRVILQFLNIYSFIYDTFRIAHQ